MRSDALLLRAALADCALPLQAWLAPDAARALAGTRWAALGDGARCVRDPLARLGALTGPAVVVLTPVDITGPDREAVRELTLRAAPGRPVLYGGAGEQRALLLAINRWRVSRVVADTGRPEALLDAIRKGHEALMVDATLESAVRGLRDDTRQLERAVHELRCTQDLLLHSERLSTVGGLTRGMGKALRRHKRTLHGFYEAAAGLRRDPELQTLFDCAAEGTGSLLTLLDELQAYAEDREQHYEMRPEALDAVAERAVRLGGFDRPGHQRNLRVELDSGAQVSIDRHRIYQVLINLIRNAFQATDPGGTIWLRTHRCGAEARVEVEDDGAGMSEEVRRRIFEPFFTTRTEPGDDGMGLGLRMCEVIVATHGGRIECESAPGRGARFRVCLPLAPADPGAPVGGDVGGRP